MACRIAEACLRAAGIVRPSGSRLLRGALTRIEGARERVAGRGNAIGYVGPLAQQAQPSGTGRDRSYMTARHLFVAFVFGVAATHCVHEIMGTPFWGPVKKEGPSVIPMAPISPNASQRSDRRASQAGGAGGPAMAPRCSDREETLAREVQALRVQLAFARGQIQAREGIARAWPEDLPSEFSPDRFSEKVEDLVRDVGRTALVDIECSEFPCIAVLSSDVSNRKSLDRLSSAIIDLSEQAFSGAFPKISSWSTRGQSGDVGLTAFAYFPRSGDAKEVEARVKYRIDILFQQQAEELGIRGP